MKIPAHALAPAAGAAIGLAAFSLVLTAQWPNYPARRGPRAPDGKPILDGPTPKTADGHPDFSGVWALRPVPGRGGRGGKQGEAPPPPPPTNGPPLATFKNIGSGFKEGLPLQPAAADLLKARRAENSKDNPDAHCLPLGLMQLHMHPQPRKIIQTPGVILILYEAQAGVRQIFLDGRTLPKDDAQPWWYGYSVGHWDGDTLVVETNNLRGAEDSKYDGWLDVNGSPYSEQAKFTEKFRRPAYDHLQIDFTVEDPKAYTKPWTVRVDQRLIVDQDLIEFECNENQQ